MVAFLSTLNPQQEAFIRNYCLNDTMRNDAMRSYAEAYGFDLDAMDRTRVIDEETKKVLVPSEYDRAAATCSTNGWRLLRHADVQARKNVIYGELLRDDIVDSRMAQIIVSGKDTDSGQMIKEYNRVTKRTDDAPKSETNVYVVEEWKLKQLNDLKNRLKK